MNTVSETVWIVGPIAAPLLAAPLALLLRHRARWILLISALVVMIGSQTLLTQQVLQHGVQRHLIGGWEAPLGIHLYADGFSILMGWLTTVVGGFISLYALGYFQRAQADVFWPLWWTLWAGLHALFLSADIFNYYVTLEILTLASVALVALAGHTEALAAALRYLLFALLGSFSYLLGVALLYGYTGVLDWPTLSTFNLTAPLPQVAAVLMTLGLLLKMALFPLHIWLPHAHAHAPAPVSALLSALVVKGSFYLLVRLWFELFDGLLTPWIGQLLGALGAAAILYGSLQALYQTRLKLLIAYSTVAQLGYFMLLFPLIEQAAWQGVLILVIAHGLAKSALFLAAGNLLKAIGHDRIAELGGFASQLPLTAFAIGLAAISIMGLPLSGGFIGKWLLLQNAVSAGQWWFLLAILAGGLLAAGYSIRILRQAFLETVANPVVAPLPRRLVLPPLILASLAIALGLVGVPLLDLLSRGTPFTQ